MFILFSIALFITLHINGLMAIPLMIEENFHENFKRSEESFLPNGNFSLVTNEKLLQLKELANAIHDPKLQDLYQAVNHYVQIAQRNNEYVLWKYDAQHEGLVLVLRQNLNGILYYG